MLLDTCALLWLAQGGGQLSTKALRELAGGPFCLYLGYQRF
jgi:PIN domain nuclease of toxin-antitoxin system